MRAIGRIIVEAIRRRDEPAAQACSPTRSPGSSTAIPSPVSPRMMSFIPGAGAIVPALAVAFASAALLALVLTPPVRRFSRAFDLVDRPDAAPGQHPPDPAGRWPGGRRGLPAGRGRRGHPRRPRAIGSVVIPSSVHPQELGALLIGGVAAAAIGFLDDALQIRARWQLLGQLAVGARRHRPASRSTPSPTRSGPAILLGEVFAVAFTVIWIVGMINSINFIDGLDGLSSGISLIAAVTLGLISLTTAAGAFGQPFIAVLCFVLAGSLLGFLRWNFHPASIFIGTSGVMFVGYTLAVLSILGTAKVAVALLVLGVPIIDTFWIIVRRIANRPVAVHARPRPCPPPAARPRPEPHPRPSCSSTGSRPRSRRSRSSCRGPASSTRSSGSSSPRGSSCSCSRAGRSRRISRPTRTSRTGLRVGSHRVARRSRARPCPGPPREPRAWRDRADDPPDRSPIPTEAPGSRRPGRSPGGLR